MKILGIDDEDMILDSLKDGCELYDHEFISAYNGKEGLRLIREQKFDIILLDYNMPGFNGEDVIRELCNTGEIKNQKIILLTVSPTQDVIDKLLKMGVKSCISKTEGIANVLNEAEKINQQ